MEITKEKNKEVTSQITEKTPTKKSKADTSLIEKKAVTKSARTTSKTTVRSSKAVKKNASKPTQKGKKLSKKSSVASPEKASKKTIAKAIIPTSEYYDLPYRYDQTIVKILAQTPHSLFIYWDVSDEDRANFIEKYGDNFFNETKPILLVHNRTLNSSFEIEIDDFTNSWYLKTPTSNCVFNIELGRKKITQNPKIDFGNNSNILHITSSNILESPNDHILKELPSKIYFKNVITNQVKEKNISTSTRKNISNLISLYQDNNEYEQNPSSGFNMFQVI